MKATDNTVQWSKIGVINHLCFISKDVICYGNGCFLHFVHLNSGDEKQLIVNNHSENGDGVKVVGGHRSVYAFAYAENCRSPELIVRNYPGFQIISKFTDGPSEGYQDIVFSESSLLLTLSDLPNFTITVWNWRKAAKIGQMNSELQVYNQMIRCNWTKPIFLAQLCQYTNNLLLWDVFTCCRTAVLGKHVVKLPEYCETGISFADVLWTTEGGLYVVDLKGCVYMMNNDNCLEKVIDVQLEGDLVTSMCWYKGGLAISGPNLEVRHYRKAGSWKCDWQISLENKIRNMSCNKSEFIIAVTEKEEIIKFNNVEISYIKQNEGIFDDVCLIYPTGDHIVTLRLNKFLNVYQVDNGQLTSHMELKHKTLCIAENPEFPYVAVGYNTGLLQLISVYDPTKLSVMASFRLTKNPIGNIKFFEQGRMIVAGFSDIGEFFLIEGMPGTQMRVITKVDTNCQVIDFMLVASKRCYRLFVIPVTTDHLAGNKIIRFCIIGKDHVNVKEYQLEDSEVLYHHIIPTTLPNRDKVFYALPFTSRSIHMLEVKRGDPLATLTSTIKTGHLLRKFNLHITKHHAVTWGFDGFVIARDNNFEKQIGMSLMHHRYMGGVKKAYIDPLGKYIITLGRENVLVCTNIVANEISERKRNSLVELKESTKFALMFRRPTIGFKPDKRFKHKTWLEVEEILGYERDAEICVAEKESILAEFHEIKAILNKLVTKNLKGPENEKLDQLEFYLDTALYNHKREANKEICKDTEAYLKALIIAQDKVANHIMSDYWNTMDVKGKVMRGIFVSSMIAKYTLLPPDQVEIKKLEWIEHQRMVERSLALYDMFEPWVIMPQEKLLEKFQRPQQLKLEDYDNLLASIADDPDATQSVETQIAMAGSLAQLHITLSIGHYEQRQIVMFYQATMQQVVSQMEVLKLKQKFNVAFEDLFGQKEREMSHIKERNARLRHIISEINYFSDAKLSITIIDPQWTQKEQPDLITKVFDHELSITPYISPSEQAMLDAKAAEEERIRLALLADDFRERALMVMMNGVLEVRWEDELKKDVPIPKCMIEKEPEQFNEEDLRAQRDYEEKVAFLNSERERYKNLLDAEYTKVSTSVRDSIRKFNQKLKDIIEFKMELDASANHENLKINMVRSKQKERIALLTKGETIKDNIKETEQIISNQLKTIAILQETLTDCRTSLDAMQAKEKLLEKSFKREFQQSSPVLQEIAGKLYKKRPKTMLRQVAAVTLLNELARCIVTQEKSLVLTSECFDYMRALDQLDQFVGLPPTIDENTYSQICKHRRLRIEFEIRFKAMQMQIVDGEDTIANFQRRLVVNKEKLVKLNEGMHQVRSDYLFAMHNRQVQIVLRRGLVELPLSGELKDFNDAILVPKKEIQDINKLIIEAGNKKINTIMQNMAFRRNIMIMEWQHRRLRMIINDFIEQLNDIESVKLTKEMQYYLKCKSLGRSVDTNSFEVEVELIRAAYEIRIKSKKEKFLKMEKQIQAYKQHTDAVNKAIRDTNIDVCHLTLQKDNELEGKEHVVVQERMDALLKRSNLVRQIQQIHNEILVLQTELELLRLKTYPTFKYKLINND